MLLEHLHVSGSLTRAELTALMGVNRSTVAGAVAELVALGAAIEERPARASGAAGRPSLVVSSVPTRLQVVAAEVAVESTTVALVGLGGSLAARHAAPTPHGPGSARRIVEVVRGLVDDLQAGPDAAGVVGLGVAVPGASAARTGASDSPPTSAGPTSRSAACSRRRCRTCTWWWATTRTSGSSPNTAAGWPAGSRTSSS